MTTHNVTVTLYRCDHCGHVWLPRKRETPVICPVCKRKNWNE